MSLSFHVDFNGQCEKAFGFYAAALGGKIGSMLRAGPREGKVVHVSICIDGVHVAGADVEPDGYEKPKGFHVLLGVDSKDKGQVDLRGAATGRRSRIGTAKDVLVALLRDRGRPLRHSLEAQLRAQRLTS